MAILENGPNGGFNGKLGNVTGYFANGKWIIRSLPKKRKGKPTPKQVSGRMGFVAVQHFLKPLLPFVRVGYNLTARSKNISAHNAAKSQLLRHAVDGAGKLQYANAALTDGNLIGFASPSVMADASGFHFTWANNKGVAGAGASDQVMVAAYCEELHLAKFILSGSRRTAMYELLPLTDVPNGTVFHVWMAFISDDRLNISTSIYMGKLSY